MGRFSCCRYRYTSSFDALLLLAQQLCSKVSWCIVTAVIEVPATHSSSRHTELCFVLSFHTVCVLRTRQLLTVASVCAYVQEPATTASGTPTTVYNASTSSSSARKLLQSASNVTATFGYTTSQAVAAAFQSTFNTSQFNQALSVQGIPTYIPAQCKVC